MKINPLSSSLIVLFLLSTACKGRGLKVITEDGEVVYTVEACSLNPVYEGCAEFLAESGALTPEICAVLGSCPQTPEEIIASIEQNYNTPRTIAPGDTVTLDGLYHASFGVSLTVDGLPVDIEPAENGEITFQAPASEVNKALGVTLTVSNTDYSVPSIYSLGSDSHPLITAPAATQCTTQSFYNATGELVQGLKNCEEAGTQAAHDFPDPSNVLSDDTVNGVSGTYTAAPIVNVATGVSYGAAGTEFTGTASIEAHSDCSTDGTTGCITTDTFKAADTSSYVDSDIKTGKTIAGVVGAYSPDFPDVGNVLSSDTVNSASGTLTLPSASNVLTGSGAYGIAGTSETPSYTPDFPDAASVLDSDTTDGDTGTITTRGSWDLASSFPGTGYYTGISNAPAASDLRRSVAVNGVTGDFPSSSSPLPRYSSASGASTATAGSDETDLTNFITQLTTDGPFEYWDSEGVRRTGSGDSDIANANVASGVDFENLSITGTVSVAGPMDLYNDSSATTLGTHTTPLGKSLEYVFANGTSGFKVWKEVSGTRILRANGEDEWAKSLNLDGKGQSLTDFQDANLGTGSTVIGGRACPDNVYIDDANKFTTTNCVYFTPEYGAQALNAAGTSQVSAGTMGLSHWVSYNSGAERWYVGNIKTCSDKGMRLPTMYETATTTTSQNAYPSGDGSPTFAQGNGIPSTSVWTASSFSGLTSGYLIWNGTYVHGAFFSNGEDVVCLLP